MVLKNNPRLIELNLAIILNNAANLEDKVKVNNILRLLKAVALTENKEYATPFDNMLINSAREKLLGADKKELSLTVQTFYKSKSMYSRKLKYSIPTINNEFPDVINYLTKEYIESLSPKYAMLSNYKDMSLKLVDFVDNYKSNISYKNHTYSKHGRYLEIKFWYIYKTLCNYYKNTEKAQTLLVNLCDQLNINVKIVLDVINNFNTILRGFDESIMFYNKKLIKEIVNYGYIDNMIKTDIGLHLLDKTTTFLYSKSVQKNEGKNELDNEEYFEKEFTPTVINNPLYNMEIKNLVSVFEDFKYAEL